MKKKVKGFSLIELLISLLIISMILSALIPAITKRITINREKIWDWTVQNNIAYTGVGANQGIIIGHNDKPLKNAAVEELLDNDDTSFTVNFDNVKLSNIGDKISILKRPASDTSSNFENSHISFFNAGYNADAASSIYAGRLAMDENNIALGKGTLQSISADNLGKNTAIGHYSLFKNTSGYNNTAIGYNSLTGLTSGKNNTSVGNGANSSLTSGNGNTAIGYNACKYLQSSSSYNICLGYNSGPSSNTTEDKTIYIGTSDYTAFYIPMLKNSDALNAIDNKGELKTILEAIYTEALTKSSDIRKKNVLSENKAGLKEINQLKVYNYTMKDDKYKTPHVGVMAQDLQKVFPDAVSEDKRGFLRIRHEDILYSLVNSIKELCIQIKSMIAQISGLDKRIKELEEQNQDLLEQNIIIQQRLDALETKKEAAKNKL